MSTHFRVEPATLFYSKHSGSVQETEIKSTCWLDSVIEITLSDDSQYYVLQGGEERRKGYYKIVPGGIKVIKIGRKQGRGNQSESATAKIYSFRPSDIVGTHTTPKSLFNHVKGRVVMGGYEIVYINLTAM